jgi:hypothetical protein
MPMKTCLVSIVKNIVVYTLLCLGVLLMLRTIALYFSFSDTVGFLAQKQAYIHIKIWKIAFYTHVFSSSLTLMAGFTQFSNYLLVNHKKVHRFIGRIYAYNIFLVNFPAGMIMAIYANGFLPSKIAFCILDCLWFAFTLKAVIEARRKNIKAHKQYMIRSYALTCSAVTLRTWKLILSGIFVIDPMTLYMIDAWMGFVPNLLFAEWLIRKKSRALVTA